MRKTSARPLGPQKTIERKQKLNLRMHVHIKENDATEEPNSTAQKSTGLLAHPQEGQQDSEKVVVNAESALLGLLALLEKCDNELKFIAAHASALEMKDKRKIVDEVKLVEGGAENNNSQEISSTLVDSEIMSKGYHFHDDVFPHVMVPEVGDELSACIREMQDQETDTFPERCHQNGLLLGQGAVESNEILPVTTTSIVEENKIDNAQRILAEEIPMNGSETHSGQDWTDDSDGSFHSEQDVQDFQALGGAFWERRDLDIAISDLEQVETDKEMFVSQNEDGHPNYETSEDEYDSDV